MRYAFRSERARSMQIPVLLVRMTVHCSTTARWLKYWTIHLCTLVLRQKWICSYQFVFVGWAHYSSHSVMTSSVIHNVHSKGSTYLTSDNWGLWKFMPGRNSSNNLHTTDTSTCGTKLKMLSLPLISVPPALETKVWKMQEEEGGVKLVEINLFPMDFQRPLLIGY